MTWSKNRETVGGRKKSEAEERDEMSKGVTSSGEESDESLQMTHHISTLLVDGGLNNIMR